MMLMYSKNQEILPKRQNASFIFNHFMYMINQPFPS